MISKFEAVWSGRDRYEGKVLRYKGVWTYFAFLQNLWTIFPDL